MRENEEATGQNISDLLNEMRNKGRVVFWEGSITYESLGKIRKEVMQLFSKDPGEKIALILTCSGGSFRAAMAFGNLVNTMGIQLVTIANSACFSAAIPVLLAGERRFAMPYTAFLLHQVAHYLESEKLNSGASEEINAMVKNDNKDLIAFVANRTGKDEVDVKAAIMESTVMDTDKAIEFGLIQAVVDKI